MGLRLQDRAFDMKCPAHLRAKLQGSRSRFVIHSRLWVYEHDKKGSRCLRRACGSLSKERQSLGVRPKRRQEGDDRELLRKTREVKRRRGVSAIKGMDDDDFHAVFMLVSPDGFKFSSDAACTVYFLEYTFLSHELVLLLEGQENVHFGWSPQGRDRQGL